ncbi:MAG: hypothetical protein QOC73_2323 [Actinomycetota bacterium]|nr:hypothetical protein [Actinomycetota bacterium]
MTDGPDSWQPPDPWAVPGGTPPGYGGGFGDYPPPRSRFSRRTAWIAGIVVLVLVLAGGGAALVGGRSHSNHSATEAQTTPAAGLHSSTSSAVSSPAPTSTPPTTPAPGGASAPAVSPGPAATTGPLDKYLLSPTEVGPGTVMFLQDGGRSATDQATLDFCNFAYTSEKLRSVRVQVQYFSRSSDPAGNEFVHYKPGGAAKAFAEIQQAVKGCPATSTTGNVSYSLVQRAGADRALAPHQLVITFEVNDTTGATPFQWQAVAYQFNGDYFSGVYVYGTTRALVLAQAQRLGAAAARHLAEAVAGRPGTGGGPFELPASPSPDGGVPA